MPYIPNLIPPENRVLPSHFTAKNDKHTQKPMQFATLDLLAAPFLFCAFLNIQHLWVACLFAMVGLVWFGPVRRRLERVWVFELTVRLRVILSLVFVCLIIPLNSWYSETDIETAKLSAIHKESARRFTADSLRQEDVRREKLNGYLAKSEKANSDIGLALLRQADSLAVTNGEKDTVKAVRRVVSLTEIHRLLETKNIGAALRLSNEQLAADSANVDLLLYRATCYLKLNKIKEAVDDLNNASSSGSVAAKRLYDKVNPVRRRVSYYTTLCSDGSESSATGRGACSWHGGVAEWNHAVYEEYRKY